jgi:hypothetical protein
MDFLDKRGEVRSSKFEVRGSGFLTCIRFDEGEYAGINQR